MVECGKHNITELLIRLGKLGITLNLLGSELEIDGPADLLTNELIGQIKDNKEQLIKYLKITNHQKKFIKINKAKENKYYEVSSAQKRLYVLSGFEDSGINYNMPSIFELEGLVDTKKLTDVVKQLINRHESLRTSFRMEEEKIVQVIEDNFQFELEYFNTVDESTDEVINNFIHPFSLEKAPLFRAGLITLEKQKHILMIDMHHIISDGVSIGLLVKDFVDLYAGKDLDPLKLQYKDYSEWEKSSEYVEMLKKEEGHWLDVFKEESPVLNMPTDYPRPHVKSFEGRSIDFTLNKEIKDKLNKLCNSTGSTLYMLLLSAFNVLLYKYSGQDDIIVGSPVSGRTNADLEYITGMFVNTISLRSKVDSKQGFTELLEAVKKDTLNAFDNQNYHFEDLVEKLDLKRDMSHNPLFDVMFTLQNIDDEEFIIPGLILRPYVFENKASKFDLTLTVSETEDSLVCNIAYSTKLFKKDTIERLSIHFTNIIKAVLNTPEIKIRDIDILTEQERHQLLVEFNDTKTEYPRDKTICQLFEEQVEKTPDNIALIFEEDQISYLELNKRSNRVGNRLLSQISDDEQYVGICMERSPDLYIGILCILKAGRAYLPIDTSLPESRIDYMVRDCNIQTILQNDNRTIQGINNILNIKSVIENKSLTDSIFPKVLATAPAYVIYTSGSTGFPKGVVITHKNVINLFSNQAREFNIQSNERIFQFSTVSFDASVEQIWSALLTGSSLVGVNKQELQDIPKLEKLLNRYMVTHLHAIPTYLGNLNFSKLPYLRRVLTGGDNCTIDIVKQLKGRSFYNKYGPTETTVTSLELKIEDTLKETDKVSIGKPISNTRVYILDESINIQPIGVPGELCISGEGLGLGYLNNPELTKERYIEHPFIKGEFLYRTGDLARWLPNGNVDFLGRIDHQVKIRGFRIELGEIETDLLKHKEVKEAVVTARTDENNNKYLCAYYTSEEEIIPADFRSLLGKRLPDYMIPEFFVQLSEIPLTTNGKVNRKALPEPDGTINTGVEYVAPTNETEEKLVEIWQKVLGVEQVGILDDFFDLGGHSLKAISVISLISMKLGKQVSINKIFSLPTIKELAVSIEKEKSKSHIKIQKAKENKYYEVSSAQKRLYVLSGFEGSGINYNMPAIFELEGSIDIKKLTDVIKQLINRHESLRTSFRMEEEKVVQVIEDNYQFELKYFNSTDESTGEVINNFIRPFKLEKAPLFRAGLIKHENQKHILMIDMHHIISDGVSTGLLVKDFIDLYAGSDLVPLKLQYKDYSEWEKSSEYIEMLKKEEGYWLDVFKEESPVLNMPTDYPRPLVISFEGSSIDFTLDKEIKDLLNKLCNSSGSTLYMMLLSAFNVLLYKYSGQDDIIVGSPVSGRTHADLECIMGMFVNTISLRSKVDGKQGFTELLDAVKKNTLNAFDNQNYHFEDLVEKLNLKRDMSHNPLFDVMFTLQNTDDEEFIIPGLILKPYSFENKTSKFDLTLSASETENGISCNIEYSTKLFNKETIERLGVHFTNIVKSILKEPEIKIREIDILTEQERQQLLVEFNDTKTEYPRDKTIVKLFEEQVAETPNNTAVLFENIELNYKELNEKANEVAHYLRNKYDIKPDDLVGVMLERSEKMIIALLGILKAGGAYVPIDPEYPWDRINYMLEDSDPKVVIGDKNEILKPGTELIAINDMLETGMSKGNPITNAKPDNLAYVIYTSGSTGRPKGTLIEHFSVVNLLYSLQNKYKFTSSDVYLLKTNYTFDVSISEIFCWIFEGGKIAILSPKKEKDSNAILDSIFQYKVTHINFVPSMFDAFSEILLLQYSKAESLKYIFLAGEVLNVMSINKIEKLLTKILFVNLYGPTEATVYATWYNINKAVFKSSIPIGTSLSNTKIYILNKEQKLVPMLVPGELCISGAGLARGYLKQPELTAEKFTDNPLIPDERMYKSGDLARWLPDGNIEFLGRIDDQVKIRGFRIELGEIETSLLKHKEVKEVKEVVVTARTDETGNKYLCAYYTSEEEIIPADFRSLLGKELPDYMIPGFFVHLPEIPLSANGKVNRKALPEPDGTINTGVEYVAPTNEIEEKLVEIWQKVLRIEQVGILDNFFDLGGHSLKAISVISFINMKLGKQVSINKIFSSPTVKELAVTIEKEKSKSHIKIKKAKENKYYEVSSAQKRLYVLSGFESSGTNYNIPTVFELEGAVDTKKLTDVIKQLINRHESLRTSFRMEEDKVVQVIEDNYQFELEYFNSSDESTDEVINNFIRPFKLEKAPLFRVGLIKLDKQKHILMIDMHHIISDGVSIGLLVKDFVDLYAEKNLDSLKLQYKDYSEWEKSSEYIGMLKKEEEYWLDIFKDELPVLNMPTDYPRPHVISFEGNSIDFTLSKEIKDQLNKLCNSTGSTLYMLLLSAFNVLLHKYSGQDDIIVGSPVSGRTHADLESIAGMFVNTISLRSKVDRKQGFTELLDAVKKDTLNAFDNQNYHFEDLIEKLDLKRDMSHNSLFDVMFTLQNTDDEEFIIPGLVLRPYSFENKTSKFDLTLTVSEIENGISCTFAYSTKLFKKETIERLSVHFTNIIKTVLNTPEIKISDVDILTEQERHQLLVEFNETKVTYPKDKAIHQLFEEQVKRTPDSIALISDDQVLTYRELNKKSNQLAQYLRNKGEGNNSVISLLLEPSVEMLISILGVLKSGSAYLPINPELSKTRIAYMVSDSGSSTLLTHDTVDFDGLPGIDTVNVENNKIKEYNDEFKDNNSRFDSAYLIYTSGTTGKPKGVLLSHENLINYFTWFNKTSKLESNDKTVLVTSYSFDLGYTGLYSSIINGSRLHLVSKELYLSSNTFIDYIIKNKISYLKLTSSLYTTLAEGNRFEDAVKNLRLLVLGGEEINVEVVKISLALNSELQIINHYGPTEGTIGCISFGINKSNINDYKNRPVIGKPINNTRSYILDKSNKLQGIGISGELCISGDGIAEGYINNPELTKDKFTDHPYKEGEKLYRTGDLARRLPDGNIEFLGRIDDQVKIRGFRIELGEIETNLLKHKEVKDAVVTARKDEHNSKYLCAYYTSEEEIITADFRSFLGKELPDYMIPGFFVHLSEIPLTANGKVNRKALPEPDGSVNTGVEYIAPANEIEEKLVEIWQKVLKIEQVGILDDFFDLGGHSLKAISVISLISVELGKQVSINKIFSSPTIKELAVIIGKENSKSHIEIKKAKENKYYEVSSAQKRLYVLSGFESSGTNYNMPAIFELEGLVDIEKLTDVIKQLINRHESLRTSFRMEEDKIVQVIEDNYQFELEYFNTVDESTDEVINNFIRPFNLEKAPLFRAGLITLEKQKHILMIDLHHIISDGVSIGLLVKDFVDLYAEKDLEPVKLHYKDYSEWEKSIEYIGILKKEEEYWLDIFKDELPVLNMPTDYPRPHVISFEGSRIDFTLNKEIKDQLNKLCNSSGSTLYMMLLSAFNVLLHKYSGQDDIIVGSPVSGRTHADLEYIAGMFVNTISLRSKVDSKQGFTELLDAVKKDTLNAFDNQNYHFEDLVEKLDLKRDMSHNPLFDVMFTLRNIDDEEFIIPGLILRPYSFENKTSKFDLTLSASETEDGISCNIEYSTKLFNKETIERLSVHFTNIVKSILKEPEIKIKDIDILTEQERHQLLVAFNDTKTEYPKDKTIAELFEEQVALTPNNTAVVFEGIELNYKELNEKANIVAHYLRNKYDIKPDDFTGILLERSEKMIIALLGILKAGGAYVPIDPEYPLDRINYMLEDSNPKVVIGDNNDVLQTGTELIAINDMLESDMSKDNPITNTKPDSLAYVIYTSGSTGKPKGTLIEHKSVNRLIKNTNYIDIIETDIFLQLSNYAFDGSVFDIYGALLNGAKLVLIRKDEIININSLSNIIINREITTFLITTALFNSLVETNLKCLKNIKNILFGGEQCSPAHIKKAFDYLGYNKIIHAYGPTENTVYTTCFKVNKINSNTNQTYPIGSPLSNSTIFILDKDNALVPVGISGELCISGDGLARGYLKRPELTAEKFTDNPFIPGERMYRTGDLARWLPDGNIEFSGRIDDQIKIRGFRIELGEIETNLLKHKEVKEAVVTARTDENNNKYLCAYYTSEEEIIPADFRSLLGKELPDYMIPGFFVHLSEIPLTANGKVNRKALPEPDGTINTGVEYVAPTNEIEEKLVEIWQKVLGVEQVGILDDFFDLGGHSLKAVTILSYVQKIWDIKISINEIFITPTIKNIADKIEITNLLKNNNIENNVELEEFEI